MSNEKTSLDYILNHLGEKRDEYYGATTPPIFQTSNFIFDSVTDLANAFTDEQSHHLYTRGNNPTVEILRKKLAALEKTEDALVFPSGMAAISMSVLSFVQAGDHIMCIKNPYSWTHKLVHELLPNYGVDHDFYSGDDLTELEKLVRPSTRMLILESPNTMSFDILDIAKIAKWAKERNIITLIDNSYSSPLYQNPFLLGVDLVAHSGTKYLNGHSDVVFGVVCGQRKHLDRINHIGQMTLGSSMSPTEAWLVIRGLRTLKIRLERIVDSTNKVFAYLMKQTWVQQVYYPFHPESPLLDLAKKQMKEAPGLLSLELKTQSNESVLQFIESLKTFKMAVSWGGHESLIMPIISQHLAFPNKDHALSPQFIRLYIGLEDANELIDDLDQASMFII